MTDQELLDYYHNEHLRSVVENNSQQAQKILLNSYFGALGNSAFRYFSLDHAKSITLSGQVGIQYVSKKLDEWLNQTLNLAQATYRIYGDTDSIYISLTPLLAHAKLDPLEDYDKALELLTKFSDGPMSKAIKGICEDFAVKRNIKQNQLDMEREAISVVGGVLVAKKKYCLLVSDLEGVKYSRDSMYVKAMGLEMSKAGTYSATVRGWLKEVMMTIILGTEAEAHSKIAEFKKEFMTSPLDEIAGLTGVSEVDKWVDAHGRCISGTPIGTKSLVNHNTYLDRIGDNEVPRLSAGDKIYYVPLRKGNPAGMDVIGFIQWTGGLKTLDAYVDRLALWEKTVISPMEIMLKPVSWTSVKKNKLF
jgi:hypothetical protein